MMDDDTKKTLKKAANTIRGLSIDGVEKANSGHPGLPLGCAEFGAFLYGEVLQHHPEKPDWMGRDRFVLSAGHGSMWLYSCLHLSGYDLPLSELKRFRQMHSKTPGHPEYGMTQGVEATTGPLGQGVANAVGMALGLKILQEKFNHSEVPVFANKVFCLCSDGCIMEGISSEASSLAGHLQMDNFVLIHDSNHICLDGPLKENFSEDTKARYKAYGFDVHELDGYDFDAMEKLFSDIRKNQKKPVYIELKTVIGKGSPHKENTHNAHGSPLGEEEANLTKEALGISKEPFYVPQLVISYFANKKEKWKQSYEAWEANFQKWSEEFPNLAKTLQEMQKKLEPKDIEPVINDLAIKTPIAGRSASNEVLQKLGEHFPQLYGGSADLSGSDKTMMKEYPIMKPKDFSGRNTKFGIREFAMSAMCSGMSTLGFFRPYCGTFLVFSDYMRNAIRVAALSHYPVIYQFTHDSIFLGEDGPTHQPIEHLMALRAIPNLHVFRPADAHEVKGAWISALSNKGPSAIILSRQNLPEVEEVKSLPYEEGVAKGAYIVRKEIKQADFSLYATGSELSLALEVANRLETMGKSVRVVSFVCWKLFDAQSASYKETILGNKPGKKVSIEAGSDLGWYKYIGEDGVAVCMESFGLSAPMQDLRMEFGFDADVILERIL